MIQFLPQLTSCVGVMETHRENGLQSGAHTQEFPRKASLFSSLETRRRIFGQLCAVIFVAGKRSREDRHPEGLKVGWFWYQMSPKEIGQCSYLYTKLSLEEWEAARQDEEVAISMKLKPINT